MGKIKEALLKEQEAPLEGGDYARAIRWNILRHKISVEEGYQMLIEHGCNEQIACRLLQSAVNVLGSDPIEEDDYA